MTLLFDRKIELQITKPNSRDRFFDFNTSTVTAVRDLRVSFSVTKTLRKEPNKAEIILHNAGDDTRSLFDTKPTHVRLLAGYAGDVQEIASGDVSFAESKHERPQWKTKILIGDGLRAYKYARISKTFKLDYWEPISPLKMEPIASIKFTPGKAGILTFGLHFPVPELMWKKVITSLP